MKRASRMGRHEARLLRRTERALREDPGLAAQFDVFAVRTPAGRRRWIWPAAVNLGLAAGTTLLMMSTLAGMALFVMVACLILWHLGWLVLWRLVRSPTKPDQLGSRRMGYR